MDPNEEGKNDARRTVANDVNRELYKLQILLCKRTVEYPSEDANVGTKVSATDGDEPSLAGRLHLPHAAANAPSATGGAAPCASELDSVASLASCGERGGAGGRYRW